MYIEGNSHFPMIQRNKACCNNLQHAFHFVNQLSQVAPMSA